MWNRYGGKRRRKECEIGMEEKEKKVYYIRSDQMMNGWREKIRKKVERKRKGGSK